MKYQNKTVASRNYREGLLRRIFGMALLALGLGLGPWPSAQAASDLHPPESMPSAYLVPESIPTPTEQLSLKINLPATRLDLYSNGNYIRSYPVAIGMPKYPTPIRNYNISYIIWNPWWIPPDSEWAQDAE